MTQCILKRHRYQISRQHDDAPIEELFDPPDADTSLDNWYWGFIGEEELTTYQITVPSPAASGLARMQISFTGLSSLDSVKNDHQVRILLNNPVGNNNVANWDGQRSFLSPVIHFL